MTLLITGAAGFIGYHTAKRALSAGIDVTGVDNFNDYYDPALKRARLNDLKRIARYSSGHLKIRWPMCTPISWASPTY